MNTIEELKELLEEREALDTPFFTNPTYLTAILGITENNRIIYSYAKMVESLIKTDNMDYEDAVEFIDYNTIRTIPYMGENAPIICYEL